MGSSGSRPPFPIVLRRSLCIVLGGAPFIYHLHPGAIVHRIFPLPILPTRQHIRLPQIGRITGRIQRFIGAFQVRVRIDRIPPFPRCPTGGAIVGGIADAAPELGGGVCGGAGGFEGAEAVEGVDELGGGEAVGAVGAGKDAVFSHGVGGHDCGFSSEGRTVGVVEVQEDMVLLFVSGLSSWRVICGMSQDWGAHDSERARQGKEARAKAKIRGPRCD